MADRSGQQLGHYRLLSLIGEGGFAEVYLGEHIHLGTQTAIKVLYTRLASEDVERFRAEARTIARLVHPHIVRVLDFGIEEHTPYLVMDYAPNGTLRARHPKGTQVPLATVVAYVKDIADALQYAHDQHLIHRDIKPENMLLGKSDEILLSDFGVALVAQSSRSQNPQDVAGTVAYMAPEQIEGHPRPASDQYALGILVYEWLTGDRPFSGSLTEIAAQHALIAPPALRPIRPNLPQAVEDVLLRALAKDPRARFVSVRAFAEALEEASQSEQPASEAPPMTAEQPTSDASPSRLPPTTFDSLPTLPATQRYLVGSETPTEAPSRFQEQQHLPQQARDSALLAPHPAHRINTLLLIGLIAVVLVAGIAGIVFFAHKSGSAPAQRPTATPFIDRHGLQANVPLPDKLSFKVQTTAISGNTTIDEWFWAVASPNNPATVKAFFQQQLPANGWTHIQIIPVNNGSGTLVIGCQNSQVMGALTETSIQVTNNQGKAIETITAPAGGSALEILLSSSPDLIQALCLNQTPTPTR